MQERYPIPKGLSGGQKIFKAGLIVTDKRQTVILVVSFFLFYLLYKQISRFLPITGTEAAIVFSPLVFAALLLAFLPIDGRHLDFWLGRKLRNAFAPAVYLYRRDPEATGRAGAYAAAAPKEEAAASPKANDQRAPNGSPNGGPARPHRSGGTPPTGSRRPAPGRAPKKGSGGKGAGSSGASKKRPKQPRSPEVLRDSVQRLLGIDGLMWPMLRLEDGTYVAVVEIEPVSLNLAGSEDRKRILQAAVGFYNKLDFPIVEMTRAREGNTADFTDDLKRVVVDVVEPEEQNLARFAADHLVFLDKVVDTYNVHERKSYFVLPYKPKEAPAKGRHNRGRFQRLLGFIGLRPTKKATQNLQREARDALHTLGARFDLVQDFCADAGAEANLLYGRKLLEFVRDQTSGEKQENRTKPSLFTPITLETGGYATLSDKNLKKRLLWAEEFRGAEDPAVGLGDLTFADKVAPDAIRVAPDWIRVGGRYHATLFCLKYGPDVGMGDLRTLLNVPGRIKVVKYVHPIAEHKAIKRAGTAWAELEAAARTADNGDLITENERNRSRQHAAVTLEELQSGKQRLFDVSLLVHCEADTREELMDLVDKTKKKLAGRRIEAKLSREESLEGFKSCLPLGKNHLESRYANTSLLTFPLSCFFLHGTHAIDHRDGVLLGVDSYSGGLVVLNTRRMTNPHMTIVGQSGSGKTATVKALTTRQRIRGHRIVVIDPVGDSRYGPVAKAMDGAYVPLGVGSKYRINPCDLGQNYMNISVFTGAADNMTPEEYEEARQAALEGALDGKCLMLTRLVDLMMADDGVGGAQMQSALTNAQRNDVERAWRELYADFGITNDPATHDRRPPIMRDFFKKIRTGRYGERLAEVSEGLYSWEEGGLRGVFSGHTNVDLSNKYLVLQIANVQGRAKAAIMYGVLEFLNAKLSDRSEPSNCYVDEFHSLLAYPMAAQFAQEMFRSGRARNNAMCAITQDIDEFLALTSGKVIFKQSATRLLLKQNRKTAEILSEFDILSDDQKDKLAGFKKGQGYLMVGENLVPILVTLSAAEKRLFNTDPEKDRELIEAASAAAAPRGLEDPLSVPHEIRDDAAAVARHLLSSSPREAHAQQDHLAGPSPHRRPDAAPGGAHPSRIPDGIPSGPPHGPAGASHRRRGFSELLFPAPKPGRPPVYAVVGEDAPHVAYNLAGLLSRALKDSGGAEDGPASRVLFVDAEGELTRLFLGPEGVPRPDRFLADEGGGGSGAARDGEGAGPFEDYALQAEGSRLAALACPEDMLAKADNALAALEAPAGGADDGLSGSTSPYACVVVACGGGEKDYYAEEWIEAADRVVAAGPVREDLEEDPGAGEAPGGGEGPLKAALFAEELRGRNGTLLAPTGPEAGEAMGRALVASRDPHRRTVHPLPARDASGPVPTGAFPAVDHPPTTAAFIPLAEDLLGSPRAAALAETSPQARQDAEPDTEPTRRPN